MADGKIYITISDKRGSDSGSSSVAGVQTPSESNISANEDKFSLATYAGTMFANSVKQIAMKAINYAINNIGNFTGCYTAQNDVQNAISALNSITSIGTSFVAGTIATGSPIGGLVAATVNAVGQGVNYGIEQFTLYYTTKKQNREIDMIRERSGLNTLIDGNRGTLD